MKQIVAIFLMVFLASPCLAQQIFACEEEHFSFEVPEGWEVISKEEIPDRYGKMLGRFLALDRTQVEAILYPENNPQDAIFPCIVINSKVFKRKKSWQVERKIKSDEEGKDVESMLYLLKRRSDSLPRSWRGFTKIDSEVYYDDERHISFQTITLSKKRAGEIVIASRRLMGSHGLIDITCYLDGEDSQDSIDLINEFVDTVSYDEGYGFKSNIVSKVAQEAVSDSWLSWVIWIVGGMVVTWIIRRLITS